MSDLTKRDLEDDVAFLLDRAMSANSFGGQPPRYTGISSNQLVRLAYTGSLCGDAPMDLSDLLACARTLGMLPRHRRTAVVEKQFEEWAQLISAGADEIALAVGWGQGRASARKQAVTRG